MSKFIAAHIPLMAWIHGLMLFTSVMFVYFWIFHPEVHGKNHRHMVHIVEAYEEEEQWHEDFDFRSIEIG